jgi:two-component system, OmpR family, phosphate regulon response regulator PhoB
MLSSNQTPAKRVLVVDDDESTQQLLAVALSQQGFDVMQAADAAAVKASLRRFKPDLVLLEWLLPDASGLEILRWMKRYYSLSHSPVIFLTERADENNRVLGLESGAEDYITKPFSTL